MPFDEEEDDTLLPAKNTGLKQVGTQKSMFDKVPKKPTQEDLDRRVKNREDNNATYKQRAANLAVQFRKATENKTLLENRSVFDAEMERDLLGKMIQLAVDINNDPNEELEGMGSLSWITLLFKTVLAQRDRINKLEYLLSQSSQKLDANEVMKLITKEIALALDSKKPSE